ncbi:hypothetical protein [Pseudoalteromonas phage H103]|uniref:hypothetical protein n=1 Tax=Pseudoalteromonas phage H103 TaxID=1636200 RepID=UPI0006BC1D53|nr:hypothetical protein AVU31_gp66 [Pseudoalteromonas phage H103]AKA61242.1 hypothetical protein [Pseudoalteromonas phage H103]
MSLFTSTVTVYSNDRDVITKGLTLEQVVLKVQRNIYGHDDAGLVGSLITERCIEKGRATFFCTMNTSQVEIKLEG